MKLYMHSIFESSFRNSPRLRSCSINFEQFLDLKSQISRQSCGRWWRISNNRMITSSQVEQLGESQWNTTSRQWSSLNSLICVEQPRATTLCWEFLLPWILATAHAIQTILDILYLQEHSRTHQLWVERRVKWTHVGADRFQRSSIGGELSETTCQLWLIRKIAARYPDVRVAEGLGGGTTAWYTWTSI